MDLLEVWRDLFRKFCGIMVKKGFNGEIVIFNLMHEKKFKPPPGYTYYTIID